MSNTKGPIGHSFQKAVLFGGASLFALCLGTTAAQAQCAPDPTPAFGTVTCTGTDSDGLTVNTNGTTVNIEAGASVTTVLTTTHLTAVNPFVFNNITMDVNGAITNGLVAHGGTADPGVMGSANTTTNLNVSATGSINGPTAILLEGFNGRAQLNIDNGGSIQSATGPAILSNDPSKEGVFTLVNRVGGTIGGIRAIVGNLDNQGLVDGGNLSAISYVQSQGAIVFPSFYRNSGTIRANTNAATVDFPTVVPNGILNTGQILNAGSGFAIDAATQSLTITNEAGGLISTVGSTAIHAGTNSFSFKMANLGTVNGNIVATSFSSFLSNVGGTINGNVIFGAGNDHLIADYGVGQNIVGISGTVDGGGGIDLLELIVSNNITISNVSLPTGFENVQLDLNNANLTLDAISAPAGGFSVRGTGMLTNIGNITSVGSAIRGPIVQQNVGFEVLQFVNSATISATLSQTFESAVSLGSLASFANSGTISGTGGRGVSISFNDTIGGLENSGTIEATHTAAQVVGRFSNTGTIRSSSGIGVDTSSFGVLGGTISTNSGLIEGAVEGIRISGTTVRNTGVISSGARAVALDFYGIFENSATGVVTGGITGVGAPTGASSVFQARLLNAGTINGDIDFGNAPFATSNTFIALPGGIVNGNLHLGGGNDLFVTSLTNNGSGPFAGVTGTVTGTGYETIRYIVDAEASAALAPAGIFSAVGYDLSNNAKLTLTGPGTQTTNLEFAGTGTVDMTANLSNSSDRALLNLTTTSVQTTGTPPNTIPVPTVLEFTSRGTLTRTRDQQFAFAAPVVSVLQGSTFRNAGTIIANDLFPNQFSPLAGVSGAGTVINDGTISVGGAVGVLGSPFSGAITFTNNGTISQLAGAADGVGVSGVGDVTNNGTILTAGPAVFIGSQNFGGTGTVTNSGAIESANGVGILSADFAFGARVTNAASGTILGGPGQSAVRLSSGQTLDNAGTINGNVELGTSFFGQGSTYVARGGTITGNLTFGSGNDTILIQGPSLGVSGVIDGGAGVDRLLQLVTADTTAELSEGNALPLNFEALSYDLSNNVKLTLTASVPLTTDLSFAGTGTVDLTADINSNTSGALLDLTVLSVQTTGDPPIQVPTALVLTSRGTLTKTHDQQFASAAPAVLLFQSSSFTNAGTIIINDLFSNPFSGAAAISGSGTVVNDGTIRVGGATAILHNGSFGSDQQPIINNGQILQLGRAADGRGILANTPVINNGTIDTGGTGVAVGGFFATPALTNNGTIRSTNGIAVTSANPFSGASVVNSSIGIITAAAGQPAVALAPGSRLSNAGTINSDVNLAESPFFFPVGSSYFANGGTINGNLRFGDGNDALFVTGNSIGVSGTIDGGAGTDTFFQGFTTNTTVDAAGGALPLNFEKFGIGAIGKDVTVTFTGPAGGLSAGPAFFGDGTIINRANVNTLPNPDPFAGASPNFNPINFVSINQFGGPNVQAGGLNFVNEARIDDGVFGIVRGFSNSGTIGLPNLVAGAVALQVASADGFAFSNSGTIQRNASTTFGQFADSVQIIQPFGQFGAQPLSRALIDNSGTITGGLTAELATPDFSFANSGEITGLTSQFFTPNAVTLNQFQPAGDQPPTRFSALNLGTVTGGFQAVTGALVFEFSNTNRIDGSAGVLHNVTVPDLTALDSATLLNSGAIAVTGATNAFFYDGQTKSVSFNNSGSVTVAAQTDPNALALSARAVSVDNQTGVNQTVSATNSGTITNAALGGSGIVISALADSTMINVAPDAAAAPLANATIEVTNSGTIRANGGAIINIVSPCCSFPPPPGSPVVEPVTALGAFAAADGGSVVTITNTATGVIEAIGDPRLGNVLPFGGPIPGHLVPNGAIPGSGSIAVSAYADFVNIRNSGTIRGSNGATFDANTQVNINFGELLDVSVLFPDRYIAGAIQTFLSEDSVTNLATGRIIGSVDLGAGRDVFFNEGVLQGNVFLRTGEDSFTQSLVNQSALMGIVDGGDGQDDLDVWAVGGTGETFNFAPFVNFENFFVLGLAATDVVGLSGALAFDTINLDQAGISVKAGDTLSTRGPVTITGSHFSSAVTNDGTIAGDVRLGSSNDTISGNGTFMGAVDLGAGTNSLTLGATGVIKGPVTFGASQVPFTSAIHTLNNAGRIEGSVTMSGNVNTATNSGTLSGTLTFGGLENTLTNNGTITGLVSMVTGTVTVTNSGTLASGLTFGSAADTLNNSGTIGGQLNLGGGNDNVTNSGTIIVAVTNTGTLHNLAGGTIGGLLTNASGTATNAGTLGVVNNIAGATFTNAAGAVAGALSNAGTATNAGTLASLANSGGVTTNSGTITGLAAVAGGTLTTTGTLSGGLSNSATVNAYGGALNGAVTNNAGGALNISGTVTSNATVANAAGAVLNVNAGGYTIAGLLSNAGDIVVEGGASLTDLAGIANAAGASITVKLGGTITDTLDNSGSASNSGTYNADVNNAGADANITNAASGVWTANLLTNGAGATVTNLGRWNGTTSNVATLTNATGANWTGGVTNETGGTLSNAGAINGTVFNAATFNNLAGGTVSGLLTNSAGTTTNVGALNGGASVTGGMLDNSGTIAGTVANVATFNNLAGGTVTGLLTNSAGTTTNAGTLHGGASVTGGTLVTSGTVAGGLTNSGTVNATGGAINGAIVNQAGGTFGVNGAVTGNGSFNNAAATSVLNVNSGGLTLAGAVTNAGTINFGGGTLGASSLTNLAGGTINGIFNLTSGGDNIINQGNIVGPVALGAGDDLITLLPGAVFGSTVDGGAGTDTLILAAGGTDASPETQNFAPFSSFEVLRQTSGTVSLAGNFSTGTINIVGGRMIGAAGSTISSGTINVASGTTFGSAGTVNANINVSGTLAPGASPGTMTVTGTVAFGAASNALFELTPTVSDKLVVTGPVSIANGTTLTLTGTRPLTPGAPLDLITATGGISGSFTTINKPASIFGFVRQNANSLQLLGLFSGNANFNPQVTATINYINTVLQANQAGPSLLAALPSLVDAGGNSNGAAFAQLNPEAYASASQIGTENGLSIAKALRSGAVGTTRDEAGAFTFAQGLGGWRTLKSSTALGISKANLSSYGALGGLGYGLANASFGAFVGYLDAKQNIDGLGARNTADGIIYGASGRIESGGFEAVATIAMDSSKGKTSRAVLSAGNATASYRLKSFVADASAGYAFLVGGNWEVEPRLGYTHVSTKRAAATETGRTAFGLTVAGKRYKADFVDATINLARGAEDAEFKPMLGFGLRQLLNGKSGYRSATAGFSGAALTFDARGAGRAETLVTGSAGFSYRLGGSASLFANYEGEFGGSGTGHNVNAGIKVGF